MAENSKKPPGKPFLPGQSGNKGGRPKELEGLKAMIREQGQPLVEQLLSIALGTATRTSTSMAGEVEVQPAFSEQTKAAEVLLAYGFGKPSQSLDVTNSDGSLTSNKLDLTKLDNDELRQLQQITAKATTRESENG